MLFLANSGRSSGVGNVSSSNTGSSWFGGDKPVDVGEQAKQWKRNLQKEMRHLDRDILNIKREEDKAAKEVKSLVKKNQVQAARILAKQIAQTRRTTERLFTAKAQMNSVCNNLQTSVCEFLLVPRQCVYVVSDLICWVRFAQYIFNH
jgi:hypothetical protein